MFILSFLICKVSSTVSVEEPAYPGDRGAYDINTGGSIPGNDNTISFQSTGIFC